MTAVRRWTSMLCLWLTALSVSAQTPPPQTRTTTTTPAARQTQPVTAETDRDLTDTNALRISLDDALRAAIERNLGISLQTFDVQMAAESLRAQYGTYDWFAGSTVSRGKVKGIDARGDTTTNETNVVDVGVSQNLPAGGNYSVFFNNRRQTGGSFSPTLGLDATQPLLRNFGIDVNRRNIFIARNTLGINRELFRLQLMDTAVTVEQAYWDLVYARRNVEVAKEAVFLARDQARITQIRIDVGAAAPLDILQPRVQIATSESQLISAVALVRSAEDRLRAVMNLPQTDWNRPIIPTTPANYTAMPVNVDQAVARAIADRPELREAMLTTATRQVTYMYARNQVLPQLDLNINYGAGTARTVSGFDPLGSPIFSTPTYSQGLRQISNLEFPAWTVGFTVGVPLTNIAARAERRRAELDVAASRVQQQQTEQTITTAVRTAARDVNTAALQITATRTARDAAEQNVEAERRRYENGMATNFEVLQIQQQLNSARVAELQALVGYNEAVANYHRQVGDILDVNGIAVNEPQVSAEPRVFSLLDRIRWLNFDRNFEKLQQQTLTQPVPLP